MTKSYFEGKVYNVTSRYHNPTINGPTNGQQIEMVGKTPHSIAKQYQANNFPSYELLPGRSIDLYCYRFEAYDIPNGLSVVIYVTEQP